jgi:predicted Rdx family selenoprotein
VAALIAEATGIVPEISVGRRGEFSIWVDETMVAEKSRKGFPPDDVVVRAVKERLAAS